MLHKQNFKVGDRVARQISIGSREEKQGIVTRAYHEVEGCTIAQSYPLYDILWDGASAVDNGYLECGIRKVEDGRTEIQSVQHREGKGFDGATNRVADPDYHA